MKRTSTSAFGVSRREGHDASGFYGRFAAPTLSTSTEIARHPVADRLIVGDARHMSEVPDNSVALVVTSPPYFAGKEYETALGEGGTPASYLEYLELLREVFTECRRVLEPGGRLAVNVANLGRRPYRSLAADVIGILQDDLGLLLRGEIIWLKARGASGSCAWGSFRSPANPVLRDLTERATRVGHPAPFPVELPERLIQLYTFRGDLVLDPFIGSGTTAVAALRTQRRYVGYDTEPSYITLAERRVAAARTTI